MALAVGAAGVGLAALVAPGLGAPTRTILGVLAAVVGTGVGLTVAAGWRVGRRLRELRLGTELMASVNPEFRLRVEGRDDLAGLAAEINRLGDRLGTVRRELEARVAAAAGDLRKERAALAAVLETLGDGVVVASPEGRITLANPSAHALLGAGPGSLLGRHLHDLVDATALGHVLERLRTGARPSERCTLPATHGGVLEGVVTRLTDEGPGLRGVVLVVRDVSRATRRDATRRRVLGDAVHRLRGLVAAVRSLAEALRDDPGLLAGSARALVDALHAAALRLSELVHDLGRWEVLDLATPPAHYERLSVHELLSAVAGRLGPDRATVSVEAGTDPGLGVLRADVAGLSAALASLVRALRAHGGTDDRRIWVRPQIRGGVVQLELGSTGRGDPGALEAMLEGCPESAAGAPGSVRETVRLHAGEVWAWQDETRHGFRVVLPLVAAEAAAEPMGRRPAFVGAGLRSGQGPGGPARAEFYDFALFDEMDRHVSAEERERSLGELEFVVFDVETTGLQPEAGDRVVSLAAVRVRGGRVRRGEVFDALVNPGRSIPPASTALHGITDDLVAEAPPMDVVLPGFLEFARRAVLVGHQVWFDVRCLAAEAARVGGVPLTLTHPILDTLALSRLVHGVLPDHSLDGVAARLGVTVQGRHSALGDALATAEILVRLLALLERRGLRTLGDVLAAVRAWERGRTDAGPVTPGGGP